jgi:hypothetical protein
MPGLCAFLADLIVTVHFMVVLFVVGSQILITAGWLLAWHWIRNAIFRLTHLLLVCFIACVSLIGQLCPLTVWEYRLRQCAGQAVDTDLSFLARLLSQVLFYDLPSWFFEIIYVAFGLLVIVTYILIPPIKWHLGRRQRFRNARQGNTKIKDD